MDGEQKGPRKVWDGCTSANFYSLPPAAVIPCPSVAVGFHLASQYMFLITKQDFSSCLKQWVGGISQMVIT